MSPEKRDYNPVASQGAIEKASGILGLRRVRESIPWVEHGLELVIVGRNGEPRSGVDLTTGERYWASEGTWLKIDVSDHELTYEFPHRATDGSAGYLVSVTVVVNVHDAISAVRRRVSGVRTYVLTALKPRVDGSLPAMISTASGDTVSSLNAGRDRLARNVAKDLPPGTSFEVDDWLRGTVTDVSVVFDASTSAHYDHLIDAARMSEINITELLNKEKSVQAEINLRRTWSKYLEPRMEDPLTRAVEVIAANPTQENIQQVVTQLDASDQWTRAEVVSILNKLIDKNFVADIKELQAIKVIVDGLQRTPGQGRSEVAGAGGMMLIEGREVVTGGDCGVERATPTQSDEDRDWTD